ncbi:Pycsar system effector family protein [Methanocella sp. MCL-LM]|uniref:Pycsar system effector family protein n=1 Tax=Methanocella sp. MCL-LM TaxID=3412035 RepID=UPI003C75B974
MDIKEKIEFAKLTFQNVQDMISFADGKANITLTLQTVFLGIGLGASLLTDKTESLKNFDNAIVITYFILTILFIATSLIGIILSINVYRARPPVVYSEFNRLGLIYFGHIVKFVKPDDYFIKINSMDDEVALKELTQQVYTLSYIAQMKMDFVNKAIFLLIINVLLVSILILISGYINIIIGDIS